MNSRVGTLATALGVTRVALGLGYMFIPKTLSRASFGPDIDSPQLRVTNKMLGSREVLLGAATVASARTKSSSLAAILLGGAAADAWDGWSALSTKGTSAYAKTMICGVALTASAIGTLVGVRATRHTRGA